MYTWPVLVWPMRLIFCLSLSALAIVSGLSAVSCSKERMCINGGYNLAWPCIMAAGVAGNLSLLACGSTALQMQCMICVSAIRLRRSWLGWRVAGADLGLCVRLLTVSMWLAWPTLGSDCSHALIVKLSIYFLFFFF
jgi:hypothetical protein